MALSPDPQDDYVSDITSIRAESKSSCTYADKTSILTRASPRAPNPQTLPVLEPALLRLTTETPRSGISSRDKADNRRLAAPANRQRARANQPAPRRVLNDDVPIQRPGTTESQ